MITEEQKKRRASGLFASDIARILTGEGVQVTLEKMGEIEPDNLDGITSVELGNILEKPVLDAYVMAKQPSSMMRSPDTIIHPEFAWMGCHLDGLAYFGDNTRVVEAKAFSAFNREGWGEPGTDEVPLPRMWQCMAQMACTGATQADIPITFVNEKVLAQFLTTGTVPIETYVIMRNEDLIAFMIEKAKEVWHCVETKTLPNPVNIGDAELIWRRSMPNKFIEAPDNIAQLWNELKLARDHLKRAEGSKLLIESKIKNFMQDASELRYQGTTLATWKNNKDGESFDNALFKTLNPDLYSQYTKPKAGARKFLLKGE